MLRSRAAAAPRRDRSRRSRACWRSRRAHRSTCGAPPRTCSRERAELVGVGGLARMRSRVRAGRAATILQRVVELRRERVQHAHLALAPLRRARPTATQPRREQRRRDAAGAAVREAQLGAHVAIDVRLRETRLAHSPPRARRRPASAPCSPCNSPRPSSRRRRAPRNSGCRCGTAAGSRALASMCRTSPSSVCDHLAHARRERVVAPVERLDEHAPGALGGLGHLLRLAAFEAIGFSHSTCLPASSARIDHSACRPFGSGL